MSAYTLVPVPVGGWDLACERCSRDGRMWAYCATILVRSTQWQKPLDEYMCWSCYDEWREIPDVVALPAASRKAMAAVPPFSFYTTSC